MVHIYERSRAPVFVALFFAHRFSNCVSNFLEKSVGTAKDVLLSLQAERRRQSVQISLFDDIWPEMLIDVRPSGSRHKSYYIQLVPEFFLKTNGFSFSLIFFCLEARGENSSKKVFFFFTSIPAVFFQVLTRSVRFFSENDSILFCSDSIDGLPNMIFCLLVSSSQPVFHLLKSFPIFRTTDYYQSRVFLLRYKFIQIFYFIAPNIRCEEMAFRD